MLGKDVSRYAELKSELLKALARHHSGRLTRRDVQALVEQLTTRDLRVLAAVLQFGPRNEPTRQLRTEEE